MPKKVVCSRVLMSAHNDVEMYVCTISASLQAARVAREKCEMLEVQVFSDRDIASQKDKIQSALQQADVFFGSLLFDYDQVQTERFCHSLVTAIIWICKASA